MSWLFSIPLRTVNNTKTQENVSVCTVKECLNRLYAHVMTGLGQGDVYDMGSVWLHYVKRCKIESVKIPQVYTAFYGDDQKIFGIKSWVCSTN